MKIFSDIRKKKKEYSRIYRRIAYVSFDRRVRAISSDFMFLARLKAAYIETYCCFANLVNALEHAYPLASAVFRTLLLPSCGNERTTPRALFANPLGYNKEYFASRKPGVFSSFS